MKQLFPIPHLKNRAIHKNYESLWIKHCTPVQPTSLSLSHVSLLVPLSQWWRQLVLGRDCEYKRRSYHPTKGKNIRKGKVGSSYQAYKANLCDWRISTSVCANPTRKWWNPSLRKWVFFSFEKITLYAPSLSRPTCIIHNLSLHECRHHRYRRHE